MKLNSVFGLLMLANGCIGFAPSSTHHYHVYVAPGFTDEQRGMILDAYNEWSEKTDSFLTFDLNAWGPNDPDTISVYPITKAELDKEENNNGLLGITWNNGSNARIEVATDSGNFYQIALHEAGHSLGCNHIKAHNNIMYATSDYAAKHVQCDDLKELCSHWDSFACAAEDMPACISDVPTLPEGS